MSLSEYAKQQNLRASKARDSKVREYHSLMNDCSARLKSALGDVGKLIPVTMSLVVQKAQAYPLNPNYPPALKIQIEQLHGCFLEPARKLCDAAGTDPRIQQHLDKIQSAKAEDFLHFQPAILAKYDSEKASGLLAEVEFLRRLPGLIAGIEPEILHLQKVFAQREWIPVPDAVCQPAPTIESEETFDPRVS